MKPYKIIFLVSFVLTIMIHRVDASLPRYPLTIAGLTNGLPALLQRMFTCAACVFISLLVIYFTYSALSKIANKEKRLLNK